MQFTADERKRYDDKQLVRISPSLLLRQHCEFKYGYPIEDLCITSLRYNYIVIGRVDTSHFRESIPRSIDFLPQTPTYSVEPVESSDDEQSDTDDSIPLARCHECDTVGIIGNLCTAPDCEDSGNLYTEPLRPARTRAFNQQHFEATGEYSD